MSGRYRSRARQRADGHTARWPAGRALLDVLPVSPDDKAMIAGGNAERVLGLKPA
jgi:predicted TIM-barrel fold metal-dependent hydrolase